MKKAEVLGLIKEFDSEDNGKIDFGDFCEIMAKKYSLRDPIEEINFAFKLFDEDERGKISFKNLKKIAKDLG